MGTPLQAMISSVLMAFRMELTELRTELQRWQIFAHSPQVSGQPNHQVRLKIHLPSSMPKIDSANFNLEGNSHLLLSIYVSDSLGGNQGALL